MERNCSSCGFAKQKSATAIGKAKICDFELYLCAVAAVLRGKSQLLPLVKPKSAILSFTSVQ